MKDKLFCDFAYWNGNWISSYDLIAKEYLSFHNFIHDESRSSFWNFIYNLVYSEKTSLNHFYVAHEVFYALPNHSFLAHSYLWWYFWDVNIAYSATIFHWIFLYAFGIFIWFLLDLVFYYIWKFLSNKIFFKKLNYNFPKFFYIFFRFIPLIWAFSVLIWSTLTDKHDTKKDLTKILIWNTLFIFVSFLFGLTIFLTCWRFS